MVAVALANTLFFAVPLGQAREKVALYLALTMAPFGVLSPLVGQLLDRWRGSYRVAVVVAAIGRGTLAIVLAERTHSLSLYPLAFGLLVLSRVHGVSRSALVPETIPPGRSLMWANSWLAIASVIGGALAAGPAIAANHFVGPGLTLWIAALIFYAGSVAGVLIPRGESGRRESVRAEVRSLLTARLVAGGIAMAAMRASVGFVTFLLAFLLRAEGETGRGFAVALVAAGIGGFVGSAVAPALRSLLHEPFLLLASLGLTAVVAAWASSDFDLVRAGAVAATVGLATGAARLAFDSLVQHDAPEAVRARTFARYETIFQVCWVAGAALAAIVPFRSAGGMRTLAAVCVVGIVLSARGLRRPEPVAVSSDSGPTDRER